MRHEEQVRLLREVIGRLDSGTNVDAGGIRRNPTSVYVDAALADRERELFFRRHPQMIGLSGDLPQAGSFFTVDELHVPIIATRNTDGTFVALVNACRHRGAKVLSDERGEATRFSCPFHGWTYDTAGALVGLPKPDHFGDIDRACHGLLRLPAVERDGLLWVHPEPDGVIDVDTLLTPALADEIAHWRFDELEHLDRDHYDVACNWKLAMDTFGETYHFGTLHRNTLFNGFHGNVQCYDTFGRNHRMILVRRAIDEMRHRPEAEWRIAEATLPAYWLFPNVQLLPSFDGAFLIRAYPHPSDPGRHTSKISFYRRRDTDGVVAERGVEGQRTLSQAFASVIRDEDYAMSVSQQVTATSAALREVVFGRNEPALHHYHNTYRAALGLDPLPLLDPRASNE
jgi:phenylpropionate dioxygenase-like ring-hydroxylating dioxygenase large terminal subunit